MEIISFTPEPERAVFDCGEPALNHYLQNLAGQHTRKNISRTFLSIQNEPTKQIAGFYSLSMAESVRDELPKAVSKKLPPTYPVPVARLSRLAVDKQSQGQRIGEMLLTNALSRCAQIAAEIGTVGVVVDAKHREAQQFYMKYGFTSYSSEPLTLFIPMQTILRSLPNQ